MYPPRYDHTKFLRLVELINFSSEYHRTHYTNAPQKSAERPHQKKKIRRPVTSSPNEYYYYFDA